MHYSVINTGSDGNATVLNEKVLIDCGVTFKKLKPYIKELQLVLLTHRHQDHFNRRSIKKLSEERPNLRFGCCEWLVQELLDLGISKKRIDVYKIGEKYTYTDILSVQPIKLYHDVSQCGYRVLFDNYKVIYMTDTKTVEGISAKNYELYLVEANYKEKELEERIKQKQLQGDFTYEWRVKDTHLSQEQCVEFLLNNMGENSEYVFMHQHVEK